MEDTKIPLREYVDIRFEAQDRAVTAALASQEKAVSKAEAASERRFESVNEFRAQLADQARSFMPRPESEQMMRAMTEKIDVLTARVNQRDDRGAGAGNLWGYILGAVGLVAAVIAIAAALM